MSFEYIDADGDTLDVLAWGDGVRLEQSALVVDIIPEDAPAVALAILEAAGIDDDSEMFAASAVRNLRRVAEIRAEKAEREAEDAKVRAWWDETRYGHTTSLCWGHMGESAHEDVRKQYRLARKFFEES